MWPDLCCMQRNFTWPLYSMQRYSVKTLTFTHFVEKQEILSHQDFFPWNQLFGNFSKNATLTKFPYCAPMLFLQKFRESNAFSKFSHLNSWFDEIFFRWEKMFSFSTYVLCTICSTSKKLKLHNYSKIFREMIHIAIANVNFTNFFQKIVRIRFCNFHIKFHSSVVQCACK